jgi:hypothetical protein
MSSSREEEIAICKLDDSIVFNLESTLPEKAKQLLEYLRSKRRVALYDRRKNPAQDLVPAITYNDSDHSEIWLTVDRDNISDTFIHEIGQVYVTVLGYKNISARPSINPQQTHLNERLVSFAINAFHGVIAEWKLEQYGIDRTYRNRAGTNFESFLKTYVFPDSADYQKWRTPFHRAELCFLYVSTRLSLGSAFTGEGTWRERVRFPDIRQQAKVIYLEASKEEITPKRYEYLQRFFLKTLKLDSVIQAH